MKKDNTVKFVLHSPREALWQFRASYNDEEGNLQELVIAENPQTGERKYATIKFHAGKRIISFPANKRDIKGKSFADLDSAIAHAVKLETARKRRNNRARKNDFVYNGYGVESHYPRRIVNGDEVVWVNK